MSKDLYYNYISLFAIVLLAVIANAIILSGPDPTGAFVGNFTAIVGQPEEPTPPPSPAPTQTVSASKGGGGGFPLALLVPSFSITPDLVVATLYQGEGKSFDVQIKNTGNVALDVQLELRNMSGLGILSSSNLLIDVNTAQAVRLDLYALGDSEQGVYLGKLVASDGSVQKEISVILEVKERKPLFDIRVTIPSESKQLFSGDSLASEIRIENVGLHGIPIDVNLRQFIMDLDQKIVYESAKEAIAIPTDVKIARRVQVPATLRTGKYLLIAEVEYNGTKADSYDSFDIVERAVRAPPAVPLATPGIPELPPIEESDAIISAAIVVSALAIFAAYSRSNKPKRRR